MSTVFVRGASDSTPKRYAVLAPLASLFLQSVSMTLVLVAH